MRKDLRLIDRCEGTVALIHKGAYSVGTICECWYTMTSGKYLYIVSDTSLGHPWVRFMLTKSGGLGFKHWGEFEEWAREEMKE